MDHNTRLRNIIATHPKCCIAGFMPLSDEPDIRPLLMDLIDDGYRLALPTVEQLDQPMVFQSWTGENLYKTDLMKCFVPNDTQVITPDIILCPLQGFDEYGFRKGRGRGYYDRTIHDLRSHKTITVIGVGFEHQRLHNNTPKAHDERLDILVTESHTYTFDVLEVKRTAA